LHYRITDNLEILYNYRYGNGSSVYQGTEKYVLRNIGDVFNMSEHTKKWMIRFGYIGIVVALIYAAGGLFLLIMKPFSINLAYIALGVSIIYALARAITLATDAGDLITLSSYVESGISIVIDIILILVIFSSDKYEYELLARNSE
jgi:hypothetical protein